ncbi:mus81 structure-specific endonuclease subunit [Anticarsia gemmatalis]|uniref:mus81 structure-specific endonuclease subunit n=1 Tax=Anticarsia gemmatalis TaxID=129554 RepID=UPI003F774B7A
MSSETGQRITYKRVRPNPLFQEWLEELYEEAKTKRSKLENMLKEALDSLSKYPLPLQSGAECAILKGFEKKLCIHLDQRLAVHKHNIALATSESLSNSSCSRSSSRITNSSSPMSDIQNVDCRPAFTQADSPKTVNSNSSEMLTLSSEKNPPVNLQEAVGSSTNTNSEPASSSRNKRQNRNKKYKPAHKSGAFAILIALLENITNPNDKSLSKEELIEKAQKHSEESFVRPKPDTFYTAWSNMTRLVTKGLVKKIRNKKVRFLLTEEGEELARELLEDSKSTPSVNDIIFNDALASNENDNAVCNDVVHEEVSSSQNSNHNVEIELPAGSFDIILLIDKNETGGLSKKNDPTVAQFNKYSDLKHEYRSLKVGDFTWIARHKEHKDQELVLPYVIERKRMDDLGASIKDGRFHEQKFRLRKCGLKNVVYMVENYGSNKHVGLPIQHLMQALANTRVQDGFKVHITGSLTDSARFLAMMTKRLTIRYQEKNLKGFNDKSTGEFLMTFTYFNQASAKTKALTVTETFIKLLLQLKGVSVEKAVAITKKYSTPRSLIIAYQKCSANQGEILLANLKHGELGRNVGPAVSKAVYQLFSNVGAE